LRRVFTGNDRGVNHPLGHREPQKRGHRAAVLGTIAQGAVGCPRKPVRLHRSDFRRPVARLKQAFAHPSAVRGRAGAKSVAFSLGQVAVKKLHRPVGVDHLVGAQAHAGSAARAKTLFQNVFFEFELSAGLLFHGSSKTRDGRLYRIPVFEAS